MKQFTLCMIAMMMILCSCKEKQGVEGMSSNGFKYKTFKVGGSEVPQDGEYVQFNYRLVGDNGEVLQSSDANPTPPVFKVQLPMTSNKTVAPVQEVVAKLAKGDSAQIFYPLDSLKAVPEQLQGLTELRYWVELTEIMDEEAYQAFRSGEEEKRAKLREEQMKDAEVDRLRMPEIELLAKDVFTKHKAGNIPWKKGPNGIQYVIHEQGSGEKPKNGEMVKAHYYGFLAETGEMFDSSFKGGMPYSFPLGQRQVIQGWDQGFTELNEGTKATLLIPYKMAYGEQGRPPQIPPASDLMFYVELVKVN